MPAKLKIHLIPEKEISYHSASVFHGWLMSYLSGEYADRLHGEGMRPYSQFISREDGEFYWNVSALDDEAKERIILPLLNDTDEIYIEHSDNRVVFGAKALTELSYGTLFKNSYLSDGINRFIDLRILTPISFKSQKKYVNYPDLHLFYSSLVNRFNALSDSTFLPEDIVDSLTENSEISRYDLRSTAFHVDGAKIRAFWGRLRVRVFGTPQLAALADMLFRFGEFSGIGIKTALGMGAIEVIKGGENG